MLNGFLPLEPYPQPRPRARAVEVSPGVWTARVYSSSRGGKGRKWHAAAVVLLRTVARGKAHPMLGPLCLSVRFVFPLPKDRMRKTKPVPREWHVRHGHDLDNTLKSLMDAMTEAGWFEDDGHVVRLVAEKVVAAQGEAAGIHVTLRSLERFTVETA